MRRYKRNGDISAKAISGSAVVLLGLNATPEAVRGLLGFAIQRRDQQTGRLTWLRGNRRFEGDEGGATPDSREAPLQTFLWGDYTVEPGHAYRYTVHPVYGEAGDLRRGRGVGVTISTEREEDATHAVFFNRGVAGSQAYSSRFGQYRRWYKAEQRGHARWREFIKPQDAPDRTAWQWLSRGLEEAILGFIAKAKGPRHALRAAVYEFDYLPVIQAFGDALERGADVKIIYHAIRKKSVQLRPKRGATVRVTDPDGEALAEFRGRVLEEVEVKDETARATDAAIREIGLKTWASTRPLDEMMIERTRTTIAHNKFIVLLEDGEPAEVWTGSTNFTAGGIFGQSNMGHVIRDREVAKQFLSYWEMLSEDPQRRRIRSWTVEQQPDLSGPPPPQTITPVFSPRTSAAMLEWYAERIAKAKQSVHFTAPFGVSQQIASKLVSKRRGSPLRYVMLESRPGKAISEKRKEAARRRGDPAPLDFYDLAECSHNRIAWGATRRRRKPGALIQPLEETLTGLNVHVEYLHTKYLLIDPLSDDPVLITGSANFSEPSTTKNDENMLVIRGNPRIADLFLCEFMRLFNHFRRRNELNDLGDEAAAAATYLAPDDSWTRPYYRKGSQQERERLLFGDPP